jgi:N-carbamoylputrescine amidase
MFLVSVTIGVYRLRVFFSSRDCSSPGMQEGKQRLSRIALARRPRRTKLPAVSTAHLINVVSSVFSKGGKFFPYIKSFYSSVKRLEKNFSPQTALTRVRDALQFPAVKTPENASRLVSVGLVQMSCSEHPEENLEKAVERIRLAARHGAQIVCLQELFRSLYFCQSEDTTCFGLAEPIPGPTTEALRQLAAELGVVVVASLFEQRAEGLFHNTAVVIDADGSLLGKYRKMHIPDDPLYYEKFYFTPGDLGFRTFQTRYAKIGVLVCWDQWFPEGARLTALSGAQILFYPTAIGWHLAEIPDERQAQHQAWEVIQRSHAVANGVYVAAVNRVGTEGGLQFWGASFVSDPFGRIVKRASHDTEEMLVVTCDLTRLETVRQNWPFLRDRRIDAYTHLTKRYLD